MKLEATRLNKSYFHTDHEVPVLNSLELSIDSGSMVSLTGTSGVGKSTLLHLLGTLDEPSSGSILWDGMDIFSRSSAQVADFRNENIGFVFQFHHLLPEFSALENVKLPLYIRRQNEPSCEEQAREMLALVGLSHRLNHKPGELSGGEQQRVALARALVTQPKLLLADEPTGNLDEATGNEIMDLMVQLNEEKRVTILLVTHNTRLAQRAQVRLSLTKQGLDVI